MRVRSLCAGLLLLGTLCDPTAGAFAADDDSCRLEKMASLPMTIDQSNGLVVEALFGGKRRSPVLIDTGASASLLRRSIATELGLTPQTLRHGVYGAGGHVLSTAVSVDVQLDRLTAHDAVFVIAPDDAFAIDPDVSASIGEDILSNYDLELDFAGRHINLFSSDHCPGGVVYWAKSYLKLPFGLDEQHQIVVSATLDGKKLRAILDTGASETFLGLPTASELFDLTPDSPGVKPDGTVSTTDWTQLDAYSYRFKTLELGGITFRNPNLILVPTPKLGREQPIGGHADVVLGHRPDLIIGVNEIAKLHLYIAYDERVIYLTPARGEP